jgi:hypothetical protein
MNAATTYSTRWSPLGPPEVRGPIGSSAGNRHAPTPSAQSRTRHEDCAVATSDSMSRTTARFSGEYNC